MAFWQSWFLDRCDGIATPVAATAALGWPTVEAGNWEAVRAGFDAGFQRGLAIARDASRANVDSVSAARSR